jgi:TolB-like protein/Tfp pilus assembly protein PilF
MPIRQLAAIMFADIVGYTGLMEEDESGALLLLEKFKKKLEQEVSLHHGRILEFRGDGALCSFSSTLECVRAALSIQVSMHQAPHVPLRIAIHTGDVIIEGDSIYGDGVNIASRMESLAMPGSIFISGRVQDDIKNQRDIRTVHLGKYVLKNVREEIDIYAVSHPGIIVPETPDPEGKGERAKIACILVLPFVNLSRDPEQEYFSDGLTEELITSLSRLKELRVISRTTSMKYKGTDKDIKTIGEEAGASYVMEGSVRSHGKKLKITAQMIDANRDIHLWADHYQGTLDDIFDIQEQVANKIAEALHLQLTSDERDTLHKRFTGSMEAYQLYLQGRFFWNKRNEEGMMTAIRFFEKAIQKDPDYALAWAGIADTYNLLGEFTHQSRQQLHPKAKDAVYKALQIDNQLAEAHISLASLLMVNEWDWEGAEKEFSIGFKLNPNYATGYHWYAELLLFQGRVKEAIDAIALAVELDPLSMAILKDQGIVYYYARQYELGIQTALNTLELDPGFVPAHRLLSLCYTELGRYDDAIMENDLWGDLIRNKTKADLGRAHILAASGKRDEAKAILDGIAPEQLGANDARGIALVYAALKEKEPAFHWLTKSFDLHEESLCSLVVDPKMDFLRSDPRFDGLVRKVGLPVEEPQL